MHAESFSYRREISLDRFEGKHHIIAGLALNELFEGEDDIKTAFTETLSE